jgi:O-antigen ligase
MSVRLVTGRYLDLRPVLVIAGTIALGALAGGSVPRATAALDPSWIAVVALLAAAIGLVLLWTRSAVDTLALMFVALIPLPISKTFGGYVLTVADISLILLIPLLGLRLLSSGTRPAFPPSMLLVAGGAVLFAGFLSATGATYTDAVFDEWIRWARTGALALLLGLLLSDGTLGSRAVSVLVGVSGLVAALGVAQFLSGGTFGVVTGLFGIEPVLGGDYLRVGGTFGYANTFAGYLAVTAPFAAYLCISGRTGGERLLGGASLALMGVASLLTFSRGGWFGLVSGLLVLLYLGRRQIGLRGLLSLAGLALALYLIAGHLKIDAIIASRIGETLSGDLASRWGRPAYWSAILGLLNGHELTGLGLGNLVRVNPYVAPGLQQQDAHANSLYLQMLLDAGWLGLAAISVFTASIAFYLVRQLRRAASSSEQAWVAMIIGAWVAFLVSGVFDYLLFSGQMLNLLALLLAFSFAAAVRGEERAKQPASVEVLGMACP